MTKLEWYTEVTNSFCGYVLIWSFGEDKISSDECARLNIGTKLSVKIKGVKCHYWEYERRYKREKSRQSQHIEYKQDRDRTIYERMKAETYALGFLSLVTDQEMNGKQQRKVKK